MISPSNLPSPAGYSFGAYDTPAPSPSTPTSSKASASSADNTTHLQGLAHSPELKPADLPLSSSSRLANSSSVQQQQYQPSIQLHHRTLHHGPSGMAGATPVVSGNGVTITTTATTTTASTTTAATTPSTTFQKSAPASLTVALCRSLVIKYIYMTYLFLFHLFVVLPTSALAKVSRRAKLFFGIESSGSSSRLNRHQAGSADTDLDESSSTQKMGYRNSTTTSMQDSAANPLEGVGAVGEKFLQQYTLDNHLGSPSSTAMSSNNNNGSMLRRSSRFKSKSDLDEFAQSSTTTTSFAAGILQPSLNTARSSTSTRAISHGYGTDSMAEDGSGDNSATPSRSVAGARLRQRMGRPSSGLGAPGSGSHGGIGARKKTLVLDLDETLIHSTSRGSRSQGYMVEVLVDRHACLYYVYKRPHVDYFLKKVAEWYKLVIFTASMAEYADPVIDWLDQSRTLFDKRYFRQACYFKNGSYLKDLTVIDPDLSSVCLLDNSPISYSLNKENGIPIDSWINDPNDEALLDLLPFLDALRFTEDVRSVLSLRTV
ncbi:MAG: NLI interacting factor-like phosphatase-domain-containing protein [Podila humilis]|nr:MAG: NLI interacting factor-like phosphatase-domain-containing protein [Podila humilis]